MHARLLVPAEPNFSPKQGQECPHAPTRQDEQEKHPAHEVGSVPAKETRIGSVMRCDNLDRAFVRACAEPFVQVIQAVEASGRHSLQVRRNHFFSPQRVRPNYR